MQLFRPAADARAETAAELRQQPLDFRMDFLDVGPRRPPRRWGRLNHRRLRAFAAAGLPDADPHLDVMFHVNGELDLDRRTDRQLRIEIGNDHLLDDAILLKDRHDDAPGLVVGAAGELEDAGQHRPDGRDHLLDALPAAAQHLDLERLGDDLRRQHAAPERPAGVLAAAPSRPRAPPRALRRRRRPAPGHCRSPAAIPRPERTTRARPETPRRSIRWTATERERRPHQEKQKQMKNEEQGTGNGERKTAECAPRLSAGSGRRGCSQGW